MNNVTVSNTFKITIFKTLEESLFISKLSNEIENAFYSLYVIFIILNSQSCNQIVICCVDMKARVTTMKSIFGLAMQSGNLAVCCGVLCPPVIT